LIISVYKLASVHRIHHTAKYWRGQYILVLYNCNPWWWASESRNKQEFCKIITLKCVNFGGLICSKEPHSWLNRIEDLWHEIRVVMNGNSPHSLVWPLNDQSLFM